ncbi:hypothetical protein BKA93DRAFT_618888 [Sparassis latifolia]
MRRYRISENVGLLRHSRSIALPRLHRLHTSIPCHSILAAHFPVLGEPSRDSSSSITRERLVHRKVQNLGDLLALEDTSPGHVWGSYVDLVNTLGPYKLPLHIHQAVLRKCTEHAKQHRAMIATLMGEGAIRESTHVHETRFQTVIRNIRTSGMTPSLEDYHFILQQFAAVGHYRGTMLVLEEIASVQLPKTTKTFGLCLQALCHRLTLPYPLTLRPRLVSEVTDLCWKLLEQMSEQNARLTSGIVDLIMRIMKESSDMAGFEKLMKMVYGIDLSYPDRPPLEYWDKGKEVDVNAIQPGMALMDPLPFSTAALNTTVDMLGRLGDVSKLVQTFEVLTTPLPAQSNGSSTPFDEDDEDDFGYSNPRVAPYRAPHAKTNTTTYSTLLKWISRAGHRAFARHYILEVMELDLNTHKRLRRLCKKGSKPEHISPPRISVNRNIFLPVFSLANRGKDMELLRFVLHKIQAAHHRKLSYIKFYRGVKKKWNAAELLQPETSLASSDTDTPSSPSSDAAQVELPFVGDPLPTPPSLPTPLPLPTPTEASFSTFFTPSTSASRDVASKTIDILPAPFLDTDFDEKARVVPQDEHFNINLHIQLLKRDVAQLKEFREYVLDILGRNTQRVKEKLGRRVWRDKDIYVRDHDDRVVVSREDWCQKVNYREERAVQRDSNLDLLVDPDDSPRRKRRASHRSGPGWVNAARGLMTSAPHSSCPGLGPERDCAV